MLDDVDNLITVALKRKRLNQSKMEKGFFRSIILFLLIFFTTLSAFSQSGYIESIYFMRNSFSIDNKYEKKLNFIARQLSSDTFGYLKIFDFTDTKGSEKYNEILSGKRADAVYKYVASRANFDSTRVYVTWLGESADIYDLHFPSAHKQKRCVDVWIEFHKKPK